MNLEQSQKEGLEEMSKHDPNCPKSEDIREDCTCPQQPTVEERFDELIPKNVDIIFDGKRKPLCSAQAILNLIQLAEQKAREEERISIMKYLNDNHIQYCINQNGLPYCKNCGLDLKEMELDLKKDN